jgi:hypothetical protein
MFEKALKVVSKEWKESLLWRNADAFLFAIGEAVKKELGDGFQLYKFVRAITSELESRNWDIRQFRNEKNATILNVFKKVVRELAREEGKELSNDALSRILNVVRQGYSQPGKIETFLFPASAFREREKWGIVVDLGDANSCFLKGKTSEGNVDWLIKENEEYKRAYFVVFHYKYGDKEGYGRCWAYKVKGAVYATNFYSDGFDIKALGFRLIVVELLKKLFEISEEVLFCEISDRKILPIYLNGDGLLLWELAKYRSSEGVKKAIKRLKTKCLWCGGETNMSILTRYFVPIQYQGRVVDGLVVCRTCYLRLRARSVRCGGCGDFGHRENMFYVEGYGYFCEVCFNEVFFYCDECHRPRLRDEAVFPWDNRVICIDCARERGAFCLFCHEYYYFEEDAVGIKMYEITGEERMVRDYVCDRCAEEYLGSYTCKECGREVHYFIGDNTRFPRLRTMKLLNLCMECLKKEKPEMFIKQNPIQTGLFFVSEF